MEITLDYSEVQDLRRGLNKAPLMFRFRWWRMLRKAERDLLDTARRNASGPPGPGVVTGAYRAAFTVEREGEALLLDNPSPQTARLEFGFYGRDALGRNYADPPRPHMYPAVAEVTERLHKRAEELVNDIMKDI